MKEPYSLKILLEAGDDYELAFSTNKKKLNKIMSLAKKNNIKVTAIGEFNKSQKVECDNLSILRGYSHF